MSSRDCRDTKLKYCFVYLFEIDYILNVTIYFSVLFISIRDNSRIGTSKLTKV